MHFLKAIPGGPVFRQRHHQEVRRRVEFLGKHRMLTYEQALLRLQAGGLSPRDALAEVRAQRKLLYVQLVDTAYFPAFQWTHVRLRTVVTCLLDVLSEQSKWHIALWCAEENVLLGGRRPIELFDSAPDAVVAAALIETNRFSH